MNARVELYANLMFSIVCTCWAVEYSIIVYRWIRYTAIPWFSLMRERIR